MRTVVVALRALLALLLAWGTVFAVNFAGGTLADALGFPGGGHGRLSWDLGWTVFAGIAAAWVAVRLAPLAPVAHAWAFFATAVLVDGWIVARMWGDWPHWFSLGVVATLPLQVWLGAWLALRVRRRAASHGDAPPSHRDRSR